MASQSFDSASSPPLPRAASPPPRRPRRRAARGSRRCARRSARSRSRSRPPPRSACGASRLSRKPDWLRVAKPGGAEYNRIRKGLRGSKLASTCARRPSARTSASAGGRQEGDGDGDDHGDGRHVHARLPLLQREDVAHAAGADPLEAAHTAENIASWGVDYVVITSVDRDDIPDGGAGRTTPRWCGARRSDPLVAPPRVPDARLQRHERARGRRHRRHLRPRCLCAQYRDRRAAAGHGARPPRRLRRVDCCARAREEGGAEARDEDVDHARPRRGGSRGAADDARHAERGRRDLHVGAVPPPDQAPHPRRADGAPRRVRGVAEGGWRWASSTSRAAPSSDRRTRPARSSSRRSSRNARKTARRLAGVAREGEWRPPIDGTERRREPGAGRRRSTCRRWRRRPRR